MNRVTDHRELIARYNDVFKEIGKLKDFPLKLHINHHVQPVVQPLRRLAFSLRQVSGLDTD